MEPKNAGLEDHFVLFSWVIFRFPGVVEPSCHSGSQGAWSGGAPWKFQRRPVGIDNWGKVNEFVALLKVDTRHS